MTSLFASLACHHQTTFVVPLSSLHTHVLHVHPITLPRTVASQDLPPAESLLQTFDNLQQLNAAVNTLFDRLSTRVAGERAKLTAICDRVARASQKVKHIASNQNRVCTIFSASKYPAPPAIADFPKVVSESDADLPAPLNRGRYRMTAQMRAQRPVPTDTSDLFQTLSHAAATRVDRAAVTEGAEGEEGLGRLPTYLPSIGSVLLFNSDENLYKKYESFNNLEGVGGQDRAKTSGDLFSAPTTLATGAELPAFVGLQFDYRPDAGAIPTLQLPTNLPLARLADISFGGSAGTSIAPSTQALFTLPTFAFDLNAPQTGTARPRQPAVVSAVPANYHALSAVGAPPPPTAAAVAAAASAPPPSAAAIAPAAAAPSAAAAAAGTRAGATAPPPAPLFDMDFGAPAAPVAVPTKAATAVTGVPANADSSAGRGNVMDAIRQGIKLRKVANDGGSGGAGAGNGPAGARKGPGPAPASSGSGGGGGGKDMHSMLMEGLRKRAALIAGRDTDDKKPAPGLPAPKSAAGDDGGMAANLDAGLRERLAAVTASKGKPAAAAARRPAAGDDDDGGDDDGDDDWE